MYPVPLREPRPRDYAELLPELAKRLGILYDDNNGFLHRAPCDIGRAIYQLGGIELSRTRNTEKGRGRSFGSRLASKGKIRKIFDRSVGFQHASLTVGLVFHKAFKFTYVWAPSERAMKGRKDQSFSTAGSLSFSTPNQLSISGPLIAISRKECKYLLSGTLHDGIQLYR